jgi:tetratricopeptide (TPR) repeat protein
LSDDWDAMTATLAALMNDKQYKRAEALCAELLKSDPGNHSLNIKMAKILRYQGNYSKALPYARAALAADISCAGCQQELADTLYFAGDYHGAIVAATAAQKLGGDEAVALETIVWANFALRAYDQVVGHAEAGQSRGITTDSTVRYQGRALARLGRIVEAYNVLADCRPHQSYDIEAQLGLMEYRLSKLDLARDRLTVRVRSKDPCRAWAFLALVTGENSWTQATDCARQAVRNSQDPTDSQCAHSALAICLANTNEIPGAEEAITKIPRTERFNNLRRGANFVIALAKEDAKTAAAHALSMQRWDESGDIGLPFIQTALGNLISSLASKRRRYLVESQALLALDPLRIH